MGTTRARTSHRVPDEVVEHYVEATQHAESRDEWRSLVESFQSLYAVATEDLPFDPRYNAFHWALDVERLCHEIRLSYCWCTAYAEFYKSKCKHEDRLAHTNFHVSYYAGNCITRIHACRDKLALMVWAFYCPFNPEERREILTYRQVLDALRCPVRFGLELQDHAGFLEQLETLRGPHFARAERYRHLRTHRREPRIEIYGAAPHHDIPYMFPLLSDEAIARKRRAIAVTYLNPRLREAAESGCYVGGVMYDRRRVKNRVWSFRHVKQHMWQCMLKLLAASAGCFRILRRRAPFRRRR